MLTACDTHTYENVRLDNFIYNCAPINWKAFFDHEEVQKAIVPLADYLKEKANAKNEEIRIHFEPPMKDIFKALEMVDPGKVKVVILGQDPTPLEGKATGLAFSVEDPRTVPSVLNVLMEVALEGWSVNLHNGDLSKWAEQGVLLLNSALTVEINWVKNKVEAKDKKKPAKDSWSKSVVKHTDGWSKFMELLIGHLTSPPLPTTPPFPTTPPPKFVWILWGKDAQTLNAKVLSWSKHKQYVIQGGHPSPQADLALFFGGNYFHCANEFLKDSGLTEINWGLAEGKSGRLPIINSGLKPCPLL